MSGVPPVPLAAMAGSCERRGAGGGGSFLTGAPGAGGSTAAWNLHGGVAATTSAAAQGLEKGNAVGISRAEQKKLLVTL